MALFGFISSSIRKGLGKVRAQPQLLYTLGVAIVIVIAFIFVANRFVGIATDAADRLVNVRAGSIQDGFVSFASDKLDDTAYLNKKIVDISKNNDTVTDFRVIVKSGDSFNTIASGDPTQIGTDPSSKDSNIQLLYTLATGQPDYSVTIPEQDPTTGERVFKTARAIIDHDGNVVALVITAQKLSQSDKAINSNIMTSIALLVVILIFILLLFLRHSRIIDYISLYEKLKGVDQLKDDFISMASHELRTPLTAIRGYSEFISEAPDLSAETKDYANKIDVSARALDGLVADILDVSRIEQGRLSFNMKDINPSQIVGDIVSSLDLQAKTKGLALSFVNDTVATPVFINVDEDRFRQVIVNFVGNSVKYTLKGSVLVRQYIEKGRGGVDIGKLCVQVQDTGIGMSAESQKHLFDKFYRIRTKATVGIPGTGLGLWITKQIVSEMHGEITVESIEGVGSKFTVSFPIIPPSRVVKAK